MENKKQGDREMNIYEKLLNVQTGLKVPKSQYNDFGKYKYRNAEDILEAVKPHLASQRLLLTISDTTVLIGDRFYVAATATLIDIDDPNGAKILVSASAREEETKKGMDGSQITGASSSYARKYALNGLFAIDDTKDSDTTNMGETTTNAPKTEKNEPKKVETKQMTLDEAMNMTAKLKNEDVKFQALTDDQLKILANSQKETWKTAARMILKSRETQKEAFKELTEIDDSGLPF